MSNKLFLLEILNTNLIILYKKNTLTIRLKEEFE